MRGDRSGDVGLAASARSPSRGRRTTACCRSGRSASGSAPCGIGQRALRATASAGLVRASSSAHSGGAASGVPSVSTFGSGGMSGNSRSIAVSAVPTTMMATLVAISTVFRNSAHPLAARRRASSRVAGRHRHRHRRHRLRTSAAGIGRGIGGGAASRAASARRRRIAVRPRACFFLNGQKPAALLCGWRLRHLHRGVEIGRLGGVAGRGNRRRLAGGLGGRGPEAARAPLRRRRCGPRPSRAARAARRCRARAACRAAGSDRSAGVRARGGMALPRGFGCGAAGGMYSASASGAARGASGASSTDAGGGADCCDCGAGCGSTTISGMQIERR